MSRTQPPAKYAICPSPRNRSTIFRAASFIDEASIAITVAAWLCEAQRRTRHSAPSARGPDSRTFLPLKRVDDEKRYRNRDAGVRHVKRRPGVGVRNVQIEEEK